jgi:HD-GYP domain-containing protein (c-di-GMP phosphodiesterase class II)
MIEPDNFLNNTILIVAEDTMRKLLSEFLQLKYVCDAVGSAKAALEKIKSKEYAVIFCDKSCEEIISEANFLSPNSVLILLSNSTNTPRLELFETITQPFEFNDLESAAERGFKHYQIKSEKIYYQNQLEKLTSERETSLDNAKKEFETSYQLTLKALVQALETRDYETVGHSERVVTFSLRLGHEIGLSEKELNHLELGAVLHDIGKIGVPDSILRKPAKLTDEEWLKMKLHPTHGQKILRNVPFLEEAAEVVMQHHECWDGTGYPHGLRGENISLGARVFAVVDAFDSIVSDKIYRKGRTYQEAINELDRCSGTQFDPVIVEAFKKIPQEDWRILYQRSISIRTESQSFQTIVNELLESKEEFRFLN